LLAAAALATRDREDEPATDHHAAEPHSCL
jgi:hypothetical protein